jgi:hypothetical protein
VGVTPPVAKTPSPASTRRQSAVARKPQLAIAAKAKAISAPQDLPEAVISKPVDAAQLSLPPIGPPLPGIEAGVVDPSAPKVIYVTPMSATRDLDQPPLPPRQFAAAAPSQPSPKTKRHRPAPARVKPLSEITRSKDPSPVPIAPDRISIRNK